MAESLAQEGARTCGLARCCVTFIASITVAALTLSAYAGETITLNGAWVRSFGDEPGQEVGVPSTIEPIGGNTNYVRKFTLDFEIPESVAILRFDGVVGLATVNLNGTPLGSHGPFTPFWFDVSQVLRPKGEENVLTVTIDDHRDAKTIPYEDIPWVNYSGIIRDVQIKFAHKVAILASRIQYTFADADYSKVDVDVNVDLLGRPGNTVSLVAGILDGPAGSWTLISNSERSLVTIDATGRSQTKLKLTVDKPKLWSPGAAQLYSLWVTAEVEGLGVDQSLDRIGFRDVAVRGNDIVLNGKPIFLKGITRHDIYNGSTFTGVEDQMIHDMVRIREMGVNFVRLIHYPQHPKILALADELGLMVSCEIPAWANFFDPEVRDRLYKMYEELILRDMNHPAVFMWLSGNARARPMPYAAEAQQLAKSLDRNRLASYVIDNDEYDPQAIGDDVSFIKEAKLDVYLKVTFWLYYLEFLQDAWTNFPKDLPIVLAELGFEGNNRGPVIITPEGGTLDVTESQQVSAIGEQLEGWRPHLPFYSHEHITGMSIFNWQDLKWPDITRHLPNHIPSLHFGVVYEDRVEKAAYGTIADFYRNLPTEFVGGNVDADAEVEQKFVSARNLSTDINTINRDSGPSINASGTRLYYASDGPNYVSLPKLMQVDLIDGRWQSPQLVEIPQETEFFAFRRAPCVSFDERTLYFTRAILSGIFVAQTRIWQSEFADGHWQQPVDMGDAINFSDAIVVTSDPSISTDGNTLYFSSDRPGGYGGTDIWVSRRIDGHWQLPQNLGPTVNTRFNDAEPSITPDGNTLYFSSGRPGGVGSSDIWVTHLVSGEWTPPKNGGPLVNSAGSDREPEISKDGNFLFFTGIRDGGKGLSDIWFASVHGAADPSDLSTAIAVEVNSNLRGTVVLVSPSDVERESDGKIDPVLVRHFRPGTPITLKVPPVFNGFAFWHWQVDGESIPDTEISRVVGQNMSVRAEYAVPVSLSIVGNDAVTFEGGTPSEESLLYSASFAFADGSAKPVRSGINWSVDDESVATIDADTGMLTPRPMRGPRTVTISAEARILDFELPVATLSVELNGNVAPEGNPTGAQACGGIGIAPAISLMAALTILRLCGRRMHGRV